MATNSSFELRTLTFIDNLQPQLTKYFVAEQDVVHHPADYDAMLIIEIAPAMEIHSMVDLALKRTRVKLGALVTERHFGQLFVQHADQGEVIESGREILRVVNLDENDRAKVEVLTSKIVRGVERDHAAYFNIEAKHSKVVHGESVFIMEATPAAYLTIACNEALKAANIKLITVKPFGATGRLVMSGTESEIDSGAEAANAVLSKLNSMRANRSHKQLG